MTATHVDGVEVIAAEPAPTGLTDASGKPVFYKRIQELLLADGRTVYGCTECDFTRPKTGPVRSHMNAHRDPAKPRRRRKDDTQLTVAELLRKLRGLQELTADRNHWKARALKAEKALATLRSALREG